MCLNASSYDSASAHGSLKADGLSSQDLAAAVRADAPTLQSVCDVYSQDVACFGPILAGWECEVAQSSSLKTAVAAAAQMETAGQPQPVVVAVAIAAAEAAEAAAQLKTLSSATGSRRAHDAMARDAAAEEEAPLSALVIAEPERLGPERQQLLRMYGLSELEAMPPVITNDTCVGLRDYADYAKETGIFRAHRQAWQRVAQSGVTTLVMESDWSFGNMPPDNVRLDLRREFAATVGLNFIGYCWVIADAELPTVWQPEARRTGLDRWLSHASSVTNAGIRTAKLCEGGDCDVLPTCATAYVLTPKMAAHLARADPCDGDAHPPRDPLDVFMFEQCWKSGGDASELCRWLDGRPHDKWHPWPRESKADLFSEEAKYFGWGLVVQDRAAFEGLHSKKNKDGASHAASVPPSKLGVGMTLAHYGADSVERVVSSLGVGWWYSWGGDDGDSEARARIALPYVAMQGDNFTLSSVRGSIAVLGTNEPNCNRNSSCVVERGSGGGEGSPEEKDLRQSKSLQTGSKTSKPELVERMRALEGMRVPIGSPAPNSLDSAAEYMDSFLRLSQAAPGLRIDFLAVHAYVGLCPRHFDSESDLRNQAMRKILLVRQQLEALHSVHGKPIWVTETNLRPDCGAGEEGNWTGVSSETIHAAVGMLISLMEDLPAVQRYAPFNWHSSHPRYAQTKEANLWTDGGALTPLGSKVAQLVADGNRVRMLAASASASPSPSPSPAPGFYRLKPLSWPQAADQVLTVAPGAQNSVRGGGV